MTHRPLTSGAGDDVAAALRDALRSVDRLVDFESAEHEAGHVVVTWLLGGCVDRVTIVPSPPEFRGRAYLSTPLPPADMAVVMLAGAAAARTDAGSDSDRALAVELVGDAGLAAARERARIIVEERRDAIDVVASALIRRRTLARPELDELRARLFPSVVAA